MEELGTTMPCMLPSFIKYRTNIELEIKTLVTPQAFETRKEYDSINKNATWKATKLLSSDRSTLFHITKVIATTKIWIMIRQIHLTTKTYQS
jgi:hypothetical protein